MPMAGRKTPPTIVPRPGANPRPPALFDHEKGVPRPNPLGHIWSQL